LNFGWDSWRGDTERSWKGELGEGSRCISEERTGEEFETKTAVLAFSAMVMMLVCVDVFFLGN